MEGTDKNYTTDDIKYRKLQLEERARKIELLKETLETYFGFEIPSYIVDDIVENEEYNHFCLIVNLAVVNDRLSSEHGDVLKQGIKEIFGIENDYEKLESSILLSKCNSRNYM